jgi:uncharacterized protein YraI
MGLLQKHIVLLVFTVVLGAASAQGQSNCGHPHGDHVVIQVKWGDSIGGLAVRSAPHNNASLLGVIPAAGTGVGIGKCEDSGWCLVKYACLNGWSYSARFLAPRIRRLNKVTGVRPNDPDGLNLRTGPHTTYAASNNIPYNRADIIGHVCQESPRDRSESWCLVTYRGSSGWAAGRFLTAVAASEQTIATVPAPAPTPPRNGDLSEACKLFPNLC